MTPDLYTTVIIRSIKEEAEGVKTFTLATADGEPISYKAGQFLTFVINHHNKEERRSFSISSSPALNEPLSITIKRVDNGLYSRLLIDRAQAGDTLQLVGASGLFTLPENIDSYDQIFFFAAGIGITPIFSLVKTALYTHPQLHITLVYSNSNKQKTVFYEELLALQKKFTKRLHIEFLFSSSFDLSRARLSKLLLPILIKELSKAPDNKTLYYTCGPFAYMRMVLLTLEELGIQPGNVKRENFNTEVKPVIKILPPDVNAHTIFITTTKKEYSFLSQYPDTILAAAQKNNINLPYSCETGRCGSCVALCTHGNVWMSNNEVLTEKDINEGKILTCVGYPVNSDVTLKLG